MPNKKDKKMRITFDIPYDKGKKFKHLCIAKDKTYGQMLEKFIDQLIKICLGNKPVEKFIAESGENSENNIFGCRVYKTVGNK